jgi:hypothetical protein
MRGIENRLRKLESKRQAKQQPDVGLAMVMHGLPLKRTQNLADGERVVIDWYRDFGGWVEGRERISSDPADRGHACKNGGYLIDVIQELHQTCSHRERSGSCRTCRGTLVAECRPLSFGPDDVS